MELSFLNPALLLGLAAAAIPAVIHLWNRRKSRLVDLPTWEFVVRANERVARRTALRNYILLALRTLALLAIPLAMARPFLGAARAVTGGGPTAAVIIIDHSYSMGRTADGVSLLDLARQAAARAISELEPGDSAAVIFSSDTALQPGSGLSFDLPLVSSRAGEVQLTWKEGDHARALIEASQLLETSTAPVRRIILISDMDAVGFQSASPGVIARGIELVAMDVSGGKSYADAGIQRVQVAPAPELGAGQFRIRVNVMSHGRSGPAPLKLIINQQEAARATLDLPGSGSVDHEFTHSAASGEDIHGVIELDDDALMANNRHWFSFQSLNQIPVLVINGGASSDRYRDETFYLRHALQPSPSALEFSAAYRTPDDLGQSPLQGFRVVVLANVRTLDPARIRELETWTRDGGGLLMTMGANANPEEYERLFGAWLPVALHDRVARQEAAGVAGPVRFTRVERGHPILTPFIGQTEEGLLSAAFSAYMAMELRKDRDPSTLLWFTDGSPALVSSRVGEGRVLVFASTLDRDWGDWPVRTSYLPVIQRSVRWLADALEQPAGSIRPPGKPTPLRPGRQTRRLWIHAPTGRTTEFEARQWQNGDLSYTPEVPGRYAAEVQTDSVRRPDPRLGFDVNVQPDEAAPRKVDAAVLARLTSGDDPGRVRLISGEDPGKRTLWSLLLLTALAAVAVESWINRRG